MINLSLIAGTEYIQIRAENEAIPEFSPQDFSEDFNIG